MSRLWTNPPMLPDGNLDYAALTLAEVREDLAETLSDLVINGGQEDAAPLLDAIEDEAFVAALATSSDRPSERLVGIMNELMKLEPYGQLPESGFELVKAPLLENCVVPPESLSVHRMRAAPPRPSALHRTADARAPIDAPPAPT